MNKATITLLILILCINAAMAIVLFWQNVQLTEYEHQISNLEGRMEDLDDAVEEDVVPRLQEIQMNNN